MQLKLENGWTLSLVQDIHPPFYSCVAWPTSETGMTNAEDINWFKFEPNRTEHRIFDMEEFIEVAIVVAMAEPPVSRHIPLL